MALVGHLVRSGGECGVGAAAVRWFSVAIGSRRRGSVFSSTLDPINHNRDQREDPFVEHQVVQQRRQAPTVEVLTPIVHIKAGEAPRQIRVIARRKVDVNSTPIPKYPAATSVPCLVGGRGLCHALRLHASKSSMRDRPRSGDSAVNGWGCADGCRHIDRTKMLVSGRSPYKGRCDA